MSSAPPDLCALYDLPYNLHHFICTSFTQFAPHDRIMMQVPLMMEDGYRAKGWLGMLLGVRLWYGFYGSVLESEAAFEGKVGELCRELGEKGKL